MANVGVFLGFCDPEQRFSFGQRRQLLALHALLFRAPFIQDNFLLSGACFSLQQHDRLPVDLLEGGILGVAARGSDRVPFQRLNEHLVQKATRGEYLPFPGDSVALYTSDSFVSYTKVLDRAVAAPAVPWNPAQLGQMYRAKMFQAALTGESGLSPADALDVWANVERFISTTPAAGSHSCSAYWLASERYDASRRRLIRQWARSYYLTNLPDAIGLSASIPKGLLHYGTGAPLGTALSVVDALDASYDALAMGLLNPTFLKHVSAEGIRALRQKQSFIALQDALDRGDERLVRDCLKQYGEAVLAEAPRHLPQHGRRIARLESHLRLKSAATIAAAPVGAGVALLWLLFFEPKVAAGLVASIVPALAKAFELNRGSARLMERTLDQARAVLTSSRYRGSIYSLVDVLHGTGRRAPNNEMQRTRPAQARKPRR